MPKGAEERVITHRMDFGFLADKIYEVKQKFRAQIFFMLTYWGIFVMVIGLLFWEKNLGNINESMFWSYFFIMAGLMMLLKACVFMLARKK